MKVYWALEDKNGKLVPSWNTPYLFNTKKDVVAFIGQAQKDGDKPIKVKLERVKGK